MRTEEGIVDVWGVESRLYPIIDASGMRGLNSIKHSFALGAGHFVDIRLTDFLKRQLSNHQQISIKEFVLSVNFRNQNAVWFRVDNESRDKGKPENYLHFHCDLEGKQFSEHQEILGEHTLAELISFTFESIYKILKEKFPDNHVINSSGFVGFA